MKEYNFDKHKCDEPCTPNSPCVSESKCISCKDVKYVGADLPNTGIKYEDNICEALEKIDAAINNEASIFSCEDLVP